MWETLASFAVAELEADAEAAKLSYEKLTAATWELQKHVKELLCDYPGAVAEEPAILDPVNAASGGEGEAVTQAARLLGSLCAQPARGDLMSAPGAIYTPKGDGQLRAPTDAGPAVFVRPSALNDFFLADVPSLRWDVAMGPEPGPGMGMDKLSRTDQMRQPGTEAPLSFGPLPGQRPTARLLRVRLDAPTEADPTGALQKQREAVRGWAVGALRELHPDASLESLHGAMLRAALRGGAGAMQTEAEAGAAAWHKLHGDDDVQARSRQPLLALFHAGGSSSEAWAAVTQAFAHGLTQPDAECSRLVRGLDLEPGQGPLRGAMDVGCPADVTPESYQSYIRELQDKMDRLLGELLREGLEDGGGSPRAGVSLSEKDVAAFRQAVTPRTYLQVVGQKLLHHAALQIPCMAELPERIPDWTLRSLYGRPFAAAVRMTIQHGVEAINDALGPCGEGSPDERIRGGKLAQSLLRVSITVRDGAKTGRRGSPERERERERERGPGGAPQQTRRFSALGGSAASATADRQRSADRVPTWGELAGGDSKRDGCQRPLALARSAVELLAGVERDVRGFMDGLTAILHRRARRPGRPRAPRPRRREGQDRAAAAAAEGAEPEDEEDGEGEGEQQVVSPHLAAAYLSVVEEELSRSLRELHPMLRSFLHGSITTAVQACLAAEDHRQSPCMVSSAPDVWPPLEQLPPSPPREQQQQQPYDGPGDRAQAGAAAARDSSADRRLSRSSNGSSCSSSPRRRGGGGAAAGAAAEPGGGGGAGRAYARSHWTEDRSAPPQIDAVSHRVLELVAWLHNRTHELPYIVQPVLLGAVIECLALLMDRLALVYTSLRDMPGGGTDGGRGDGGPLARALLSHCAACCVVRRLEAMTPWLGAPARQRDTADADLARQYGEALVQADELVTSIQQHIVMSYMQVVYDVVLSCLDRTDWTAYRPEVNRGKCAGPAVRVWHSMMLRMMSTAVRHASPRAAEWITGEVVLESVGCLAQRCMRVCPTAQMLPEFVADAVHLTASVFLLCQPVPVAPAAPQHGGGAAAAAGRGGGDGFGPRRQDSATEGADTVTLSWLRLPYPIARALAGTMRDLLTRAALLYVSGADLEEAARRSGLLANGGTAAAAVSPACGQQPPVAPASAPSVARRGSGDGVSDVRESNVVGAGVGGGGGFGGGGGNGATRLAPLPALCAVRVSVAPTALEVPTGPRVSTAGPVSEGRSLVGPDSARSAGSDDSNKGQIRTRSRSGSCSSAGAAAERRPAPASAASTDPRVGVVAAGAASTDEERLTLWTSWLPVDIVRLLTGPGEAIALGGGGGGAGMGAPVLIPLADRMAEDTGQGRMWRACLAQLAQQAGQEQVLLAVSRRPELHAAVGTEPEGDAENRTVVRQLARRLGLVAEGDAVSRP